MNLDGSGLIQLTDVSGGASEPAANDEGSKIAFTSPSSLTDDIYVMNRDGSNVMNLSSLTKSSEISPCFCGNGTEIVYSSDASGNRQVWKMRSDGSQPTRLTGPPDDVDLPVSIDLGISYAPDLSHDNAKIVYVHGVDSEIWMMNGDGSNKTYVGQNGTTPRFNEMGSMIVFARDGDIYTMHLDGTQVKKLTTLDRGEFAYSDPAFSPDGKKIAFMGKNSASEIFIMDSNGKNVKKLTNFGVETMHPNFIRVMP
jgi:TolB protein